MLVTRDDDRTDGDDVMVARDETTPAGRPRRSGAARGRRSAAPDAVCAAAVEEARAALVAEVAPATVGDHLGVEAEGERLVAHLFACTARGYRGWRWTVSVARPPRARTATVCETVLLPGPDAVLAPSWVPWSDRLAPGDLGAHDVLPYRSDDPCLQPGYTDTGDEEGDQLAVWELGLGRRRVLSPLGRERAATRWYRGPGGPTSDIAVRAPAQCSTCGYFVPLAGAMRRVFGACANEWSPSDGRVVAADHGCGAHSETDVDRPEPEPLPPPILDETGAEAVVVPKRTPPSAEPGTGDQDAPADEPATTNRDVPAEEPTAADQDAPAAEPVTVDGDVPAEEPEGRVDG